MLDFKKKSLRGYSGKLKNPSSNRGFFLQNQQGFTLLEIILVLGILGIISLLAINSYGVYRKNILLDLGTDDFVSQIELAKFNSQLGKNDAERYYQLVAELENRSVENLDSDEGNGNSSVNLEADLSSFCQGILLEKEEEIFVIKKFTQKFQNKKRWNPEKERFEFVGCEGDYADLTSQEIVLEPLILEEGLNIKEILNKESPVNQYLFFRFAPPNGDLDLEFDGQKFTNQSLEELETGIAFDLLFQFSEDEKRQQNLELIFTNNDFEAKK